MADTKVIVDCSTGETKVVELTAQEIAQRDQMAAQAAEDQAARQAEADRVAALKVSAKAKLVAGEPLTADEAAVLVL
jgi:predicted Fe-Mo cluster-binding NifX family protein